MTDEEERAMVDSELLRMLEDVANREIPCQVAYADIQKRIAAARAEGAEAMLEKIREARLHGYRMRLAPYYPEEIALIPASVLAPEVKK